MGPITADATTSRSSLLDIRIVLSEEFLSRCGVTRIQPAPTRRTIAGHENKTTSVEYRDDLVLHIQLVVETGKT